MLIWHWHWQDCSCLVVCHLPIMSASYYMLHGPAGILQLAQIWPTRDKPFVSTTPRAVMRKITFCQSWLNLRPADRSLCASPEMGFNEDILIKMEIQFVAISFISAVTDRVGQTANVTKYYFNHDYEVVNNQFFNFKIMGQFKFLSMILIRLSKQTASLCLLSSPPLKYTRKQSNLITIDKDYHWILSYSHYKT